MKSAVCLAAKCLNAKCLAANFLAAALSCCAALPAAAALDCKALRGTALPYEIKLERRVEMAGQEPAIAEGKLQVFRKDEGSVTFQSFSPDTYFRARYPFAGFPVEFFVSKEGTRIDLTYSTAPYATLLADEKPVSFHVTMKRHDGQIVGEQDHAISFMGRGKVEVAGCDFEVIKSARKVTGLINDTYSESDTEFWYAPDLRSVLYIKTEVANGPSQTYSAKDLSIEFKAME